MINKNRRFVPEEAADETITFTIGYSDIVDIKGLPENASVASKLIDIETSKPLRKHRGFLRKSVDS